MSRHRGIDPQHRELWSRGKCRWCLGPVPTHRHTFCGASCVHEWKIRSQPGYARQHVFARDRGVCAACGRDCPALQHRLEALLYTDTAALERELAALGMTHRCYGMADIDRRVPVHLKGKMGRPVDDQKVVWTPGMSFWEADHVVAVVDGGGSCGLGNLQTLCSWCHRAKTAELAARRAKDRARPPDDLFDGPARPPPGFFDD